MTYIKFNIYLFIVIRAISKKPLRKSEIIRIAKISHLTARKYIEHGVLMGLCISELDDKNAVRFRITKSGDEYIQKHSGCVQ